MPTVITTSPDLTVLDFSIAIDVAAKTATLTDTSTYTGTYIGRFYIEDAYGDNIYSGTFTSPDTDTSIPDLTHVQALTTIGSELLCGEYTFKYEIQDSLGDNYELIRKYTICGDNDITVVIQSNYDCRASNMLWDDRTNYSRNDTSTFVVARSWTITPPAASGLSTTTSAAKAVTIPPNIWTGNWEGYLTATVTYTYPDTTTETVVFQSTKNLQVDCDTRICEIGCVVNKYFQNWRTEQFRNGPLAEKHKRDYETLSALSSSYFAQVECGDEARAADYIAQIELLIGTSISDFCGCEANGIIEVVPASAGASYSFVNTGNVDFTTTPGSPTVVSANYDTSAILALIQNSLAFTAEIQWNGAAFTVLSITNVTRSNNRMNTAPVIDIFPGPATPTHAFDFKISQLYLSSPVDTFKVQATMQRNFGFPGRIDISNKASGNNGEFVFSWVDGGVSYPLAARTNALLKIDFTVTT